MPRHLRGVGYAPFFDPAGMLAAHRGLQRGQEVREVQGALRREGRGEGLLSQRGLRAATQA